MRILYGVAGEGMGHATRSRVVIDALTEQGHEVQVVVSGRAHAYLKQREHDRLGVHRIWGLTLVYEDNEVRNFRTILQNVRGAIAGGWPRNVRSYFEVVEKFQPEVIVSDFETWSYLFGLVHRIPVISLDNNQIVNRCEHPREVIAGRELDYAIAKTFIRMKLPGCFHYLVTTFFFPKVTKPRTTLHPPVLRPEILAARPEPGEHLLVYQTSTSNPRLPELLRRCGRECRIYGLRRDLTADERDGNLLWRPFSETRFVDDLRTAKGVVSGGGFTLMSEAVYLHKPMLSVPVKKQFEQILNARYLERLGYGVTGEVITAELLDRFLERLPELEKNLERHRQDGNADLLAKLDERLRAAVGMRGWEPEA